jgi:hypothetical protein
MKGEIPHYVTRMIEMILVVVLLAVVLFTQIPQAVAWLQKNIFGTLSGEVIPTGTEEATSLEAAIKCSYLRCSDGCGKESVKGISIGSTKNCDTDFCQSYQKDGKVCGDNAKANPVKVTLANNQVITREKLKSTNTDDLGACLVKSDSCNAQLPAIGWVNIQKGAMVEKEWETTYCRYANRDYSGYDKVVVIAGKYEVWTTTVPTLLGGFTTVVCIPGVE